MEPELAKSVNKPNFTLKVQSGLAGFSTEDGPVGTTEIQVVIKSPIFSSFEEIFHVYFKQISNIFLSPKGVSPEVVHTLLIVLHANDEADVYINNIQEMVEVKVKRDVNKGEVVRLEDIDEIRNLTFPGVKIRRDDVVIYSRRFGWHFFALFDFSREIDPEKLSEDLGRLQHAGRLQEVKIAIDSAIQEAKRTGKYDDVEAIIYTEGRSDSKIFYKASKKIEWADKRRVFFCLKDYDSDVKLGDSVIVKIINMVVTYSLPVEKRIIAILDSDNKKKVMGSLNEITPHIKALNTNQTLYKIDDKIFLIFLPIPKHRSTTLTGCCVEAYFSDEQIMTQDSSGRRLFLGSEFNFTSGRHVSDDFFWRTASTLRKDFVIEDNVFDNAHNNVALTKSAFAKNIYHDVEGFNNFDFSHFTPLFELLSQALRAQ